MTIARFLRPIVEFAPFLILPAALVAVLMVADDPPTELRPAAQPVWVDARASPEAPPEAADLEVMFLDPEHLVAPPGSGIVTEVFAQPGDVIASGDPLYSVDSRVVLAFVADRPLYRELESGTKGADVEAFRAFLVGLDVEVDEREDFSFDLSRRAAELRDFLGWPDTRIVAPDQFVWVPEPGFQVDTTELIVGAPVPTAGTKLMAPRPAPSSARFVARGSQRPIETDRALLVRYTPKSDPVPTIISEELARFLPAELVANLLADADEDGKSVRSVELSWESPMQTVVVPNSSVVSDPLGETDCVWTQHEESVIAQQIEMRQPAALLSPVSGIDVGTPVLANPAEILDDFACPSFG